MADRSEILENYLKNDLLVSLCELDKADIKGVNFSENSNDILIEALKRLIFSYCQKDAQITILKNVNAEINKNI